MAIPKDDFGDSEREIGISMWDLKVRVLWGGLKHITLGLKHNCSWDFTIIIKSNRYIDGNRCHLYICFVILSNFPSFFFYKKSEEGG